MGDADARRRGGAGSFHRARVVKYRGLSVCAADCRLSECKQHGLVAAEVREWTGIAALKGPPGAATLIAKVNEAAVYGSEALQCSGNGQ